MSSAGTIDQGATVVITHRVREGQQDRYVEWMNGIRAVCERSEGFLDWQLVRPIPGVTATFTVIVRFTTRAQLERWMRSPERARLIEEVRPHLDEDDTFVVRTGLDFWFPGDGAGEAPRVPVRWKQLLVTWSAIYPLSLGVSIAVMPRLHALGLPQSRYGDPLLASGLVVALMGYLVMPPYTRLLRRWLYG